MPASTTLDDIINELKLTYDPSVGLLDGESLRTIPSLNTLLNLKKLFTNLSTQLREVEAIDNTVLGSIKEKRPIETDEPEPKRRLTELPPPVQSGSFTQDNDTRLKNPKLEFVQLQTLSAEAIAELGLYSEDNNGLETQGKEYLKKKYGVASYPENDLLDLLPGPVPDIDFSKNKNTGTQVLFSTFQTYIELYFRPYTPDDIDFLEQSEVIPPGFDKLNYDPNVTPYLIPKLRRFYAEVWAEEDPALAAKLGASVYQLQPDYKPKGTIDDLLDDLLYTEEVSCGPLSSRLFLAILGANEGKQPSEDEEIEPKDEDEDGEIVLDNVATKFENPDDYKVTAEVTDFNTLEDRLRRELKYVGIFMNLPDDEPSIEGLRKRTSIVDTDEWVNNREDDEVCAEIRSLQKTLRQTVARNRINKKRLVPIVEDHMAYQEYCTILEDLDKQVDQAYMKRLKGKNKKKKVDNAVVAPVVNSGLRALLEKRRRWIENIGRLFPPAEVMKRVPAENVLVKEAEEEEEEE